jgi:hypothetical protein
MKPSPDRPQANNSQRAEAPLASRQGDFASPIGAKQLKGQLDGPIAQLDRAAAF